MTTFENLNILNENLVQYFTGSYVTLGLLICVIFAIVLLTNGLDFSYVVTMTIPLLGFFVAIGWFGTVTNNQWIINAGLLVVSVIYGTAIVKLST